MHEKLNRKQPALVDRHGVLVLHDNTRLHVLHQTVQRLHELEYEIATSHLLAGTCANGLHTSLST